MEMQTEQNWAAWWASVTLLTLAIGLTGVILGKPDGTHGAFLVDAGAVMGVAFVLMLLPAIIPLMVMGALRIFGKTISYIGFFTMYIPLWLLFAFFWLLGVL